MPAGLHTSLEAPREKALSYLFRFLEDTCIPWLSSHPPPPFLFLFLFLFLFFYWLPQEPKLSLSSNRLLLEATPPTFLLLYKATFLSLICWTCLWSLSWLTCTELHFSGVLELTHFCWWNNCFFFFFFNQKHHISLVLPSSLHSQ